MNFLRTAIALIIAAMISLPAFSCTGSVQENSSLYSSKKEIRIRRKKEVFRIKRKKEAKERRKNSTYSLFA